nr:putative retrotransposon Ty1-copia subclass protein [Tanacetum cinerariifolium]
MHFLLSSMSVVYVLITSIPDDDDDDDATNVESSKELYDSLKAKYMAEDASSKKFLVSNFPNYKMTDSRQLRNNTINFLAYMEDLKHTLKYLKKKINLVELGSHLRIEESLEMQDSDKPKGNNVVGPLVVNMVEHNSSSRMMMLRSGWTQEQLYMCVEIHDEYNGTIHAKKENGRMILESVKHDPLIWYTIEENGVTKTKKYAELFATEKIQADCDIKEINIILQENSLIDQEASGSLEDLEIFQEEDTHPSLDTSLNHEDDDLEIDKPQSDIVPICRSTRTRHAPDHPKFEKWLNAMNVEMQSMKDNEVWFLVELPHNDRTVGSKWLFKKKTDMDGNVHIYKARLVAKGSTQTPWIDYEETYSPVADIRAIRILIAIAAYYDYEIWKMDVKMAFLNGYLNEEEKLKLRKSQGASTPAEMKCMQNVPYASTVGSIRYDVRCTRPDVAFAQNITS